MYAEYSNNRQKPRSEATSPVSLLRSQLQNSVTASFKLNRHHSMSQSLTKTVLSGSALERKSHGISRQNDREFSYHDGLVDMYIEDILHTGEKMYSPKKNTNIRAKMTMYQLLKHDIKVWYRRWKIKGTENPIFKSYIKYIESNFGSSIGSLFVFVRWVILLNLFLSLVWLSVVVIPTAVTFNYNNISQELEWMNFIDGEGAIRESWLFYGGYPEVIDGVYHIALAYLMMILLTYFGSLFVILNNLGGSDRPKSASFSSRFKFSSIIFSSWDHGVTSADASNNLSVGISSVLKDNISEDKAKARSKRRNRRETYTIIFSRILAWGITIILIGGGCATIVWLVLYEKFSDSKDFLSVYLPSIIFSLINIIIPLIVSMLPGYLEHYSSGKKELRITLSRIFILRMANLFALIVTLYKNSTELTGGCTGTVIGQEFYKLVIMDTIVHAVVSTAMSIAKYKYTKEKSEFNISAAVLVLIYRQGLVWVGTIACPLMPLLGALSSLVFFFLNYAIIKYTCKPPIKRWNQSRNTAFIMGFLLTTLVVIIAPVSVVVGSHRVIQLGQTSIPGKYCGPFSDKKPTEAYGKFKRQLNLDILKEVLQWLSSDSVLIPLFLILVSLLSYQRKIFAGEKQHRLLLQAELTHEREDNRQRMKKMQELGIMWN
ncbi:transmembrane channel-like protein 7 isoform X1 [Mytilus galloprovincialis]|uniref:transmembrane channel-like protein 7 isoform X1 n=1 Tax=Mytilus galloprovincialis TaxID=29158 RepID=UPI003F7C5D5B